MRPRQTALAFLLAIAVAACGARYQRSLDVGLRALSAASAGFAEYDRHEQERIVSSAATREDGEAALAAYRERRQAVLHAIVIAYSALALAAEDPSPSHLGSAVASADALYRALAALRGP